MMLIARRDDLEAWADEPFDPATDEVTLKAPGRPDVRVLWQSALRFGYWENA